MWSRLPFSLVAAGVAALILATSGTAGCARPVPVAGAGGDVAVADSVDETVTLEVHNDNFYDVTVSIVSFGGTRRVGVVTGNTTQKWPLRPDIARASDLRILAEPIGARGRASSGTISVRPGQTIEFTVGSRLSNSVVFVH